jgi:hypothetical protein
MAKHSSIVGGSNAGRLLNCPASHQAILALPPSVNISSEYAEEGTAMHAVMDALMRARSQGIKPAELRNVARSWVTREFHDRKLTFEHIDTMVVPALNALGDLEAYYGGGFSVIGVELRVRFPGLPGAFGTLDLMLQSQTHLLHVDWKFGAGVGVSALYPAADGVGEIVNPQLMFYLASARNTFRKSYSRKTMVVAIIQPRGVEPLTHTTVVPREVKMFVEDIHAAVLAAIDRDPPRIRGEHCRFAPCKLTCPHWTGPLLDLSALGAAPPKAIVRESTVVTAYGHYLAKAKLLVDSLVMLKAEIDEQMHAYLEAGGTIPGWRLKAKAKQRQWVDMETVADALEELGFAEPDIWQEKLQTFQHVDAVAKRMGVTIPEHLRVAPPTNETTIARTDDPAPVVEPHVAVEQFRAALAQLQGTAKIG